MGAATKVKTFIVNRTSKVLILKVGNQNCFAKLATIGVGCEHKVEIDVNWTYQEFCLEPVMKGNAPIQKIVVSSDDCCDFERITVTEIGGRLQADKVARRRQFNSTRSIVPVIDNWRTYFTWPNVKWRFWL